MHVHSHAPDSAPLNAAFKWAVLLNAVYVLAEAGSGFATGSLALLADAAHNLMDVAGLLLAWGAAVAAKRPARGAYTYGYGRTTILAALLNAVLIMLGVGAVLWEAVGRFAQPVAIPPLPVMAVATLGIVLNAGTALLFRAQRHADLNAKGAFLHMMTDAGVSLGVVLGGAVVWATGWGWVDPAVAIGVSVMVALATVGLLKDSLHLTLDGAPAPEDLAKVAAWLGAQPGVASLHDLHIWALSTTRTALTAHLVMPGGCPGDAFLTHLAEELDTHFKIGHATFQVETGRPSCCCTHCDSEPTERKKL